MLEYDQLCLDARDFSERLLQLPRFGLIHDIKKHDAFGGRVAVAYFMEPKPSPDRIAILRERLLYQRRLFDTVRYMNGQYDVRCFLCSQMHTSNFVVDPFILEQSLFSV